MPSNILSNELALHVLNIVDTRIIWRPPFRQTMKSKRLHIVQKSISYILYSPDKLALYRSVILVHGLNVIEIIYFVFLVKA